MGNHFSKDISEDEELMRLLAIQLETDNFLLNEILQEEISIEEENAAGPKQKRTMISVQLKVKGAVQSGLSPIFFRG